MRRASQLREIRKTYRQAHEDGHGPVGHYKLIRRLGGSRLCALAATWHAYVLYPARSAR